MENRVHALRRKLGLSQQQLADAVGTSQQQIARIETGNQAVKLDVALQLAAALGTDLTTLFPGTRGLLKGKKRKAVDRNELLELHSDPDVAGKFEAAGVDVDPATWILKLRMRGGHELEFVCSPSDARRLQVNIRDTASAPVPFFVFHSAQVAVALNLRHLVFYHELWDGYTADDWQHPDIPAEEVAVYFSTGGRETFQVDPDEGLPDVDNDEGQMRGLLYMLETFVDEDEWVDFLDADGERAFFRASEIAAMTIPLRDLDERLNEAMLEGEFEEMAAKDDTGTELVPAPSEEPANTKEVPEQSVET